MTSLGPATTTPRTPPLTPPGRPPAAGQAGAAATPPRGPMVPAPLAAAPPHSGPAMVTPDPGVLSKAPARGVGGRRRVPAPFCGRRGCGSYAVRGSEYCGADCERLVREARAQHRSPYYAPGFVERVAALLAQKLSRAQVGDALGVSKNVICGIIHRRNLRPAKPHVVVMVKPAKPKRVARPVQPRAPTRRAIQLRAAAEAARVAAPIRVCLDTMPGDGCQFPTSENPWRICDDPRVPSSPAATRLSPYCAVHIKRAYLTRAA